MFRYSLALTGLLLTTSALAVPEGPAPNTAAWFEREAANYARTLEAPLEQVTTPGFLAVWQGTSTLNIASLLARNLEDPSWLIAGVTPVETLLSLPLSPALLQALVDDLLADPQGLITPNLNTPLTPLCTSWSQPCSGDPTRYPHVPGPNGTTFYGEEADVSPVVFYDAGCARISGRVWAPRGAPGRLPGVVIENGSIQAPEPLYWWFAQALVRAGYVVLTFDPRGQGRSDQQTPTFEQGSNINSAVFFDGLVDAVDFFRSSPTLPYGQNLQCAGTYPTAVAAHNPFHDRIDPTRLGLAGHSLGASGVSTVAGYPGDRFQFPAADGSNPVDVIVAWDSLRADPDFPPRVPAMGQTSEYGIGGVAFLTPPDPDEHLNAFKAYQAAGVPVSQFTIQGSTHFEWSQIPVFPSSSWCADLSSGSCAGGWGQPMAEHYSLAWMDRWLKRSGEPGHADADARLLADADWCERYSFHFRSARDFPLREGGSATNGDVRAACLAAKEQGLPSITDGGGGLGLLSLWVLLLAGAGRAWPGRGPRRGRQ
ncbi:hypothetical protein JN531_001220 [Flagellatimonas centrodinii]|uniref:alpha/beta hydrolase family protein n=1 Tax=Flagellatimonas centrodinii TaxID=2806210 RepID=UPI001FEF8976|nr:hypothetical protein [Flagellatimonas centrodinii]ULQ46918.1 hypothetical protein JN531_001220 [Flagellatimonas centrodinii]